MAIAAHPPTTKEKFKTMKVNRLLLITLLAICFGTTFSQTKDSLSVFPNPISSSTTIHFDIVQTDTITLNVFNSFGETVRTYFESTVLTNGSYNVSLNGDSLEDGMYVIRLEIGSTKKITVKAVKNSTTSSLPDYNSIKQNFTIYPNPTKDLLIIPSDGYRTIIFTSQGGQTIKSMSSHLNVISIADLDPGQYIMTVFTERNELIITQKILKSE